MNDDEILNRLRDLMPRVSQAKIDWPAMGMETPLRSLGFDSLSIMDLAYDVSQEFQVEFDLLGTESIRTVGDVVRLINRLRNAS